MKKFYLSLLLLVFSAQLFAQKEITVLQSELPMSKGSQPSYQVVIPQVTLNELLKEWAKYTRAKSKGKATLINGETLQPLAVNKNISSNLFSVYSKAVETTEGVKLTIWLSENDSIFISKKLNADQNEAALKYVRDFAINAYKKAVEGELDAANDIQEDLESELKSLINEEERATKKISESKRAIDGSNSAIRINNGDLQNQEYRISDQKRLVDQTQNDKNANKGAKKTLQEMESEKKKMMKSNESNGKSIDNENKKIRDEERNITELKLKQQVKAEEIIKQKQVVKEIKTKLENIK